MSLSLPGPVYKSRSDRPTRSGPVRQDIHAQARVCMNVIDVLA
ncbi:hypothetical protein HDF08_002601 [Edaphobacter lichenicola]|uniref:Uncharacterized protein n=1 Tax=Tunturiibacter lichenicola TaxID=2051959 RepID=A0A852VHG3_9BACT|nr:hypothetical protein [Edaphobacter lichenicola]